ncbi:DUF4856 domain-containing protein [Polaribacter batillariae]|uniref:DUF4856 domain-containing protein n=1 Tax=Polaribacter batillariae TaxID=2808900 RepID=A0ABX7SVI6_9FLAO|nr:DUF4856 domain-containing protein [Polaribacter batillariae]QTD38201.1 DUF4856 domain-containing protein [Polaribacter batillariae]
MKKVLVSLAVIATLVSCNKRNNDLPKTVAPATYSFERNGESTVDFNGQTTRIKMAGEFISALKNTSETEATLDAKFAHTAGNADFSDADLNASSKNIRSKVAASRDFFSTNSTDATAIKNQFDGWIAAQVTEVFPNWNTDAAAGVAGNIQQAGGGSTRYVNGKGVEYNQLIAKSLIGGLMVDQILNNYLSKAVLDEGTNVSNNNGNVTETDKNYTTMEHKWDEAFGYLYGNEADITAPTLKADKFLNEYVGQVNKNANFAGIATEIYNAFKLGRAAIVAKDYNTRDTQVEILREKISKVLAVRAVYYFQQGKIKLPTDKAAAFHALSEAIGFVYSLQFTRKPNSTEAYFTKTEVDNFMNTLLKDNGFWDVTNETLDLISTQIASKFGFKVADVAN